ncbi:MAG: glycosyltransferase [Actinomycetota bacterium]|nr:glycosyltransferase [Actinomycetota bacterium]
MRVLVATTAGAGHFSPLVPFAEACREAGHDVLVAAPQSFAPSVERRNFVFWPCADTPKDEWAAVMARLPHLSHEEANAVVVGEVFGRLDARATLPGMLAAIEEWRPDLILRENAEFGSYVAAERYGLPQVRVATGLGVFDDWGLPLVVAPLAELRRSVGLVPDDEGARLRASPCVTLVPPSMEDPAAPGGPRARFKDPSTTRTRPLPEWWGENRDPLVYVTFGSVAGTMPMFLPVYQAVVAAIAELPVRVLVTTGEGLEPDSLGPFPDHVHVQQWVPQPDVLREAAAMVCHGGFNTVLGGLAAGLPMAVVPLFADQPENAGRVAALGAGEVVAPDDAGSVGSLVSRLLADASYRQSARRVAEEIDALPPTSAAVALLERAAAS